MFILDLTLSMEKTNQGVPALHLLRGHPRTIQTTNKKKMCCASWFFQGVQSKVSEGYNCPACQSVQHFSVAWNITTTTGWIAIKFWTTQSWFSEDDSQLMMVVIPSPFLLHPQQFDICIILMKCLHNYRIHRHDTLFHLGLIITFYVP